ncbi:AAA family ATPase [Rhodococcus sp. ACS1]|uniref:phosphatase domain-containing protein n=1 Tax=Rhodococcus sp. ACS1 TaxID=2028570 RepID=UPI0015C6BE6A|nr:AAA family ATPase [Rhodococcus sp. ACS1]
MSNKLILTRGWPGSGKSTYAEAYVANHSGSFRVNRDDLRKSLFNGEGVLKRDDEEVVTAVQQAQAIALLKAGQTVVIDDTNLRLAFARDWADIAADLNVEFEVVDFRIDVEECILRDAERKANGGRGLGEAVIRKIAKRNPTRGWQPVTPRPRKARPAIEPYVPNLRKPRAWLFDIDGTLAHMDGGRGPFDWAKVGQDRLDEPLSDLANLIMENDRDFVILMSGRDSVCRSETRQWLSDNHVQYDHLFMRPEGDGRKDSIVKAELFDKHIRHDYYVQAVFDDRDQVVEMWRSIGLPCYQVAPGAF